MRVYGLMIPILAAFGGVAFGSPAIDSAVIHARVFNDDPASTLVIVNTYPALVSFSDTPSGLSGGFANRHNFRLSADGGVSEAAFNNGDGFAFYADVTVSGTGSGDAGLNVSPWWSQQVDGQFQVRNTDGEIAAFGGRIPFYSFTASQGLHYTTGETVRMGVIYNPHSLSAGDPATAEYLFAQGGTTYASGALPFDEGNAAEDPPYGLWGMLNDARVGGFAQILVNADPPTFEADFENMVYFGEPVREGGTAPGVPEPAALALFGLAGLGLSARSRRKE